MRFRAGQEGLDDTIMSKRISDFLLVTDLDQTLLDGENGIPKRNLLAIERFRKAGGRFTIATGRSIESARRVIQGLGIDTPAVLNNGSVVYDYKTEQILLQHRLPDSIKQIAYDLLDRFPSAGGEAFSGRDVYILQYNDFIHMHIQLEGFPFLEALRGTPTSEWTKVLFADSPEVILHMSRYAAELQGVDARFVMSSPSYLEILPQSANKGTGLVHLAKNLGVATENTAAIGDYYNDAEMIQAAGIGAFAENAPDDLKKTADIVVGQCKDGAVADLIEYIETLCSPVHQ